MPVGKESLFRYHGRRRAAVAGTAAASVAPDIAPPVEVDLTTGDQQLPELRAGALHAGLHPGRGQAEPGRCARLDEPLELGQRKRFSVDRGEPSQQRAQTLDELAARLRRGRFEHGLLLTVEIEPGGPFSTDRRPSVVVGDRVSRDLVDPCADGRRVLEISCVAVDAQHDVLEDVLGTVAVWNAPSDEAKQARVEVLPDRLGVERFELALSVHRHPQPSPVPVPQQSAIAATSQQDSCSEEEQQALSSDSVDPVVAEKKRARFSGSS